MDTESPMMMPLLPTGFRFNPTRQELVLYLQRKVDGFSLLPSCIAGIFRDRDDFYGDNEPWKLLDDATGAGQYFYVFTGLKKVSDNSKRIHRKAGSGTWNCRTKTTVVEDFAGRVIGFDKYYTFEVKGDGADGRSRSTTEYGKWTMHELSLSERQSPGDVVLCVIGRDTMISISDDPKSSVTFAKHFGKDQCNVTDPLETLKKSEKRKLMESGDDEQQTSRKRACVSSLDIPSGFAAGVEESSLIVSDYELCDHDSTNGNHFADGFSSIPDDSGVMESLLSFLEEPEILPSGVLYDSLAAYNFTSPFQHQQ